MRLRFDAGTWPEGADIPFVAYVELQDGQRLASSLVKAVAGADTGFDVQVFHHESVAPEVARYTLLAQNPAAITHNPDGRPVLIATPGAALTVDGYWRRNTTGYVLRYTLRASQWGWIGGQTFTTELTFWTINFGAIPVEFLFGMSGTLSLP